MRIENNQGISENLLTENGTVSAVEKGSNSNAGNNSSVDEELFLRNLQNENKSRSNSVNGGSLEREALLKQASNAFNDPHVGVLSKN